MSATVIRRRVAFGAGVWPPSSDLAPASPKTSGAILVTALSPAIEDVTLVANGHADRHTARSWNRDVAGLEAQVIRNVLGAYEGREIRPHNLAHAHRKLRHRRVLH